MLIKIIGQRPLVTVQCDLLFTRFDECSKLIAEDLKEAGVNERDPVLVIYDGFTVKQSTNMSEIMTAINNQSHLYLVSGAKSNSRDMRMVLGLREFFVEVNLYTFCM